MKIFAGKRSVYFADKICKELGVSLNCSERKDFSDGEFVHALNETVRGENVYLIQSTFQPTDNLFELLQMADASKRAGAKSIVAVIPYFGFARQDKKDGPRMPITAALTAKMIEASGVNHVVTMDLHAEQIQGYFNIPVSHLYSSTSVVPFVRESLFDKNIMVAAPDMGASKRAKAYAQYLQTDMVICYKQRAEANKIKEMTVIGNVEGRDIIIVDDMADTAGTLCTCANMLLEKGANSVRAMVTHPILSGKAYENIGSSKLEELIVTNSIPLRPATDFSYNNVEEYAGFNKITVVDVAPLFASVIHNIENHTSISANFIV